ncbi:MAG: hypothetical protein AUF67_04130 [Acidobacteria bacterium 13_1_20CM_58_21]|nr:MAG: hypothetical protein AUF67_04130 [Acidobacteria bacterium 13_1_20CM_58_21]
MKETRRHLCLAEMFQRNLPPKVARDGAGVCFKTISDAGADASAVAPMGTILTAIFALLVVGFAALQRRIRFAGEI